MIAKGDNDTKFYIWLDRRNDRIDLCGPGWKSLYEAYDLHMGDVVTFAFSAEHNHFYVSVLSGHEIKPLVRVPGMFIVPYSFCVLSFNL